MERPTIRKIMGLGWTYCPRCNENVMVPDGPGWHCPFCGIHLVLGELLPMAPPELMVWSEQLTSDERVMEHTHLQEQAQRWVTDHKDIPSPRPPRRVRYFVKLTKPLAKVMGVVIGSMYVKKDKEVTK